MKRISGAFLAIAGAALLAAGQALAQVERAGPDVIVESGLEPLLQTALRAAAVPEGGPSPRAFPPNAAGRAFCLSGGAFMLLATDTLPPALSARCHVGGAGGRFGGKGGNGAADGSDASGNREAGRNIVSLLLAREPLAAVRGRNGVPLRLNARTLFLALTAWIPRRGRLVRNPYDTWNDLHSTLPEERIQILLPESARKAVKDFLRRTCKRGELPYWEARRVAEDAATYRRQVTEKCAAVREDGAVRFVEGGDEAVLEALSGHGGALALVGRGAWLRHENALRAASLEDDAPSRPLFLIVDKRNLRRNAMAGKVLAALAEAVRWAGLLPPPPEQREALFALLKEARVESGAPRHDERNAPATGGQKAEGGPLSTTMPPPPRPRARGGVELVPAPEEGPRP